MKLAHVVGGDGLMQILKSSLSGSIQALPLGKALSCFQFAWLLYSTSTRLQLSKWSNKGRGFKWNNVSQSWVVAQGLQGSLRHCWPAFISHAAALSSSRLASVRTCPTCWIFPTVGNRLPTICQLYGLPISAACRFPAARCGKESMCHYITYLVYFHWKPMYPMSFSCFRSDSMICCRVLVPVQPR